MKLTPKEKRAIKILQKLSLDWPDTLWLFAADGVLYVMRNDENGEHIVKEDRSVDQSAIVDRIYGIDSDGGGW